MTARNILIADDDADIAEMIASALRQKGFDAQTAGNGRTALERIETKAPALLVTDVDMPEMDGLKLCRRLRAGGHAFPIIIMSGSLAAPEFRAVFERAGATDCIAKPFAPDELIEKIRLLLPGD